MTSTKLRKPDGALTKMPVSADHARAMDGQIAEIVAHHINALDAARPLKDQLIELGRNCYMQGLLEDNPT